MKKNNIMKIIISVCMLAAMVFAAVACDNGENVTEDNRTFEESWMSYISDETLVSKVVMPGSHDAGTRGADVAWETQLSGIGAQLDAGSRYFDCRATYNTKAEEYYFIHANSGGSDWGGRAFGVSVRKSLEEIKAFIERNPQEVLILDFQHTWTKTEDGLIELIKEVLPTEKILSKTDCENPVEITFGEMREMGKNIIILYRDEASDICEKNDILFERSLYLQSDWDGDYHKDTTDVLVEHWQHYFDVRKDGVFFVLQGQMSVSPLQDGEAAIRPLLSDYLKNTVATDPEKLAAINVVMKDFIANDLEGCEVTAKEAVHDILSLNVDKGTVKADKLEEFKAACGYSG